MDESSLSIGRVNADILAAITAQASTLTLTGTGRVGPVTPRIYWSCKNFTGPTKKYSKCQLYDVLGGGTLFRNVY